MHVWRAASVLDTFQLSLPAHVRAMTGHANVEHIGHRARSAKGGTMGLQGNRRQTVGNTITLGMAAGDATDTGKAKIQPLAGRPITLDSNERKELAELHLGINR